MSETATKGAKGSKTTTAAARMRRAEANKWVTGLKVILDAINQHRAEFLTPEFPTTGEVHGNICPQTVGTFCLNLAQKGVAANDSGYLSDPTCQPFNVAFQSTAWLRHALDIKSSTNNFADNKERLEGLNLCIKNAKRIDDNGPTTIPSVRAKDRAIAAHDALLIPTSHVDDLESFIFVLADFCMRNSKTYRRLSEFPVPKWIMEPVSHAALIEKELILEHGICAWEHDPVEFVVFSKLFADLARHLRRARDAERMYQTIAEAMRCGNRWSTSSVRPGVDGQNQQLRVRRRIEVGRVYAFFVEVFNGAIRQIGSMDTNDCDY